MILRHNPLFHHVAVLCSVVTITASSSRDLPYLGVSGTVQYLSITDPDDGGGRFGVVGVAGEV